MDVSTCDYRRLSYPCPSHLSGSTTIQYSSYSSELRTFRGVVHHVKRNVIVMTGLIITQYPPPLHSWNRALCRTSYVPSWQASLNFALPESFVKISGIKITSTKAVVRRKQICARSVWGECWKRLVPCNEPWWNYSFACKFPVSPMQVPVVSGFFKYYDDEHLPQYYLLRSN